MPDTSGAERLFCLLQDRSKGTATINNALDPFFLLSFLKICATKGVPAQESVLWQADLQHATEMFLCASVREIVPIVRLDDKPVGSGQVGPKTRQLQALYRAEVDAQTQPQA